MCKTLVCIVYITDSKAPSPNHTVCSHFFTVGKDNRTSDMKNSCACTAAAKIATSDSSHQEHTHQGQIHSSDDDTGAQREQSIILESNAAYRVHKIVTRLEDGLYDVAGDDITMDMDDYYVNDDYKYSAAVLQHDYI